MSHIELIVNVEPKEQGSDVLIAELSENGFESFVENDTGFSAYISKDIFDESVVKELFSNYASVFNVHFTIKTIEQQNWNKEWESSFSPIEVDGKCIIRAPFHEAQKGFVYDIIIEPKMSFGTGHHNTTQLMIQKLMKLDVPGKSLLDMGCGTGVLAILAAMMKATAVTAIDTDEWSYENTIENINKNTVSHVDVYKGDVKLLAGKIFHIILANINKNVLLADMAEYHRALEKGGDLILSGFFETDISELQKQAEKLGMRLAESAVSSQWAMLHFIKNK
ncbi:MAG: 50S ribosomal protein L11 methyltransferase [Bacteroidia bacterium]|jgi:ribosomal protein L11 methyltransferase